MEKCRLMKRLQCMSKNWIYSWLWKSPRKHTSSMVAWQALRWKRIFLWMDQRSKKRHLIKSGIRMPCNTENFVPVVVLVKFVVWIFIDFKDTFEIGESFLFFTCSKWNSDTRTRRWDLHWHLSVSTSVGDGSGQPVVEQADQNPKTKWKGNHDRTLQPVEFWDPGMAARIQGKCGGWWNSSTRRLSRQFEDARLRPIRLRPAGRSRNWPKSKLAEVDRVRKRTHNTPTHTQHTGAFYSGQNRHGPGRKLGG